MSQFEKFYFLPEIYTFLKEEGIKEPTPVQAKTISPFLAGENLSVLAQTGTGKTLAYLLPIFQMIKENDDDIPMESQIGAPRVIIITPTRELTSQVFKITKSLAHTCKLRIRKLVGGDKSTHVRKLANEAYDILVTNPGRLNSAFEKNEIKKELIEVIVLDEADQLLDMGFASEIIKMNKALKGNDPQICLYSATEPGNYKNFLEKAFLDKKFKRIELQGVHKVKRTIETFNIHLGMREKPLMLATFIEKQAKGTGVVFFNRKEDVQKGYDQLKDQFPRKRINQLHGGLSKEERKTAYKNFAEKGGLLLCSDIAARGLDIKDLKWVLNYDLPFEAVYYIHRCGRTGRNGAKGSVFNFVTHADAKLMQRINEAILNQSSLALKALEAPKRTPAKKSKNSKGTGKKAKVDKKASKKIKRKNTPRYKKKKVSKRK